VAHGGGWWRGQSPDGMDTRPEDHATLNTPTNKKSVE